MQKKSQTKPRRSLFSIYLLIGAQFLPSCYDAENDNKNESEIDSDPSDSPFYLSLNLDGQSYLYEFEEAISGVHQLGGKYTDEDEWGCFFHIDSFDESLAVELGILDGEPGFYLIQCVPDGFYECFELNVSKREPRTYMTIHRDPNSETIKGTFEATANRQDWVDNSEGWINISGAFKAEDNKKWGW